MLSQTYISAKTSAEKKGTLPKARYINVTKKFNPHLGPSDTIKDEYDAAGKTAEAWEVYKPKFLKKILSDPIALEKIDKIIIDSLTQDVVLMCFESEKNYSHRCHRFLLLDIAENRAKEKKVPVKIKRANYLIC
jgi:hypothetical protein